MRCSGHNIAFCSQPDKNLAVKTPDTRVPGKIRPVSCMTVIPVCHLQDIRGCTRKTRLFSREQNRRIMPGKIVVDTGKDKDRKDPAECNHRAEPGEIRRIDA